VDLLLNHFEKYQQIQERGGSSDRKKRHKAELKKAAKSEYFFPKYLTNSNLYELEVQIYLKQLNDPFFRRQFLSQYLSVSHFLVYTLLQAKDGTPIPNKSVHYHLSLSQEQVCIL
jgi:hypothetical protein